MIRGPPIFIFIRKKIILEVLMKILYIKKSPVEVTDDVYTAYLKEARRFKYFTQDLKLAAYRYNAESDTETFKLPREVELNAVLMDICPSDEPDLLDQVLQKDLARDVHTAIKALPPMEGYAVFATFYLRKSQTEIAVNLGVSQMSVSRYLKRARSKLAISLAEYNPNKEF